MKLDAKAGAAATLGVVCLGSIVFLIYRLTKNNPTVSPKHTKDDQAEHPDLAVLFDHGTMNLDPAQEEAALMHWADMDKETKEEVVRSMNVSDEQVEELNERAKRLLASKAAPESTTVTEKGQKEQQTLLQNNAQNQSAHSTLKPKENSQSTTEANHTISQNPENSQNVQPSNNGERDNGELPPLQKSQLHPSEQQNATNIANINEEPTPDPIKSQILMDQEKKEGTLANQEKEEENQEKKEKKKELQEAKTNDEEGKAIGETKAIGEEVKAISEAKAIGEVMVTVKTDQIVDPKETVIPKFDVPSPVPTKPDTLKAPVIKTKTIGPIRRPPSNARTTVMRDVGAETEKKLPTTRGFQVSPVDLSSTKLKKIGPKEK